MPARPHPFDLPCQLIFRDEERFFSIVQSTPDITEAVDLVRRARAAVLKAKLESRPGAEHARLDLTVTRLNDELHYQTRIEERAHLKHAIKALFGEDAWPRVLVYRAEIIQRSRRTLPARGDIP